MARVIRYGRTRCRGCGAMVTNNALGRSRHSCEAYKEKLRKQREKDNAQKMRRMLNNLTKG
jgi:hypothetical protein